MKYANGEKGVGVHDTISFRIIWRYNNKQIRDAYSTFTSAQRNKKKNHKLFLFTPTFII